MEGFKYTPSELGRIAYEQGLGLDANPFKPLTHSLENLEWDIGWLVARAEARMLGIG